MARVTSKRQVTIPKRIADRFSMAAGDEIEFVPMGDAIRVQLARTTVLSPELRLERFDRATERQRARQEAGRDSVGGDRGWRRDDLYERGRPR